MRFTCLAVRLVLERWRDLHALIQQLEHVMLKDHIGKESCIKHYQYCAWLSLLEQQKYRPSATSRLVLGSPRPQDGLAADKAPWLPPRSTKCQRCQTHTHTRKHSQTHTHKKTHTTNRLMCSNSTRRCISWTSIRSSSRHDLNNPSSSSIGCRGWCRCTCINSTALSKERCDMISHRLGESSTCQWSRTFDQSLKVAAVLEQRPSQAIKEGKWKKKTYGSLDSVGNVHRAENIWLIYSIVLENMCQVVYW